MIHSVLNTTQRLNKWFWSRIIYYILWFISRWANTTKPLKLSPNSLLPFSAGFFTQFQLCFQNASQWENRTRASVRQLRFQRQHTCFSVHCTAYKATQQNRTMTQVQCISVAQVLPMFERKLSLSCNTLHLPWPAPDAPQHRTAQVPHQPQVKGKSVKKEKASGEALDIVILTIVHVETINS